MIYAEGYSFGCLSVGVSIRVIERDIGGVKAGVGARDSELIEAVLFQLSMRNLWSVLGVRLF